MTRNQMTGKMQRKWKKNSWRKYALGAGGYDESKDRYGTTGQMPARRCQSYSRRGYSSHFITCISLTF